MSLEKEGVLEFSEMGGGKGVPKMGGVVFEIGGRGGGLNPSMNYAIASYAITITL